MVEAIKLTNVHKKFKDHQVLNGINFTIQAGQIIGLLGANGAGKSTLIKIMTGLLKPDSGSVELFGQSFKHNSRNLRKYLGTAPQTLGIYDQLTIKQNLMNFGRLSGLNGQKLQDKYQEVLPIFDLQNLSNDKAANLSGGQKRRLHSAIALMNEAKIVFLDEPTVGADIDSRNRIIHAVQSLSKRGITVIYTTHYLQEMESLNADIMFLNHGQIMAQGKMDEIINRYAKPTIKLYFQGQPPQIKGWQKEKNCLINKHLSSGQNYLELVKGVLNQPELQDQQLLDLKIIPANLESAYHSLLKLEVR
ncbi:ABC transporter ATP-binding protein [Lactobacillus sp. ESL0731]|uniref:ABC transporter ATP-binding protein n=1 Tax=unclassified Lactobacillus TaxID=2620435 RepID=UPI0023F7320B|nr:MULTISPECIES: ABC transporter ATP-binding protein [unclassified Lactobacillus]WEV51178.1 ABC transporter ATP-binding protein [Lactobacillus sp. ESL0700]WEV62308.1 ABC transporter ATP-binding protein [Lactobacillus sp. ESL0731]